jgi:hypothetical protein
MIGQFFLIQQDQAWTLWVGLTFFSVAAFLWIRGLGDLSERAEPELTKGQETALFTAILLVGLFFRAYHLGQYPPGLYSDAAKQGLGALRILHEGWNPFQEPDQYLGGSLASGFYELALWFRFFSPTPLSLLWGTVMLSLLAFPFFYYFFRRLSGPGVALTALFIFATMRWDLTYARGGHPATDYPLYLFGTLAFFLSALRTGSRAAFAAFILFAACGCYSYEAFVAVFPALAVFVLYEYRQDPSILRKDPWFRVGGLVLFVGLTFPAWRLHWERRGFGAVYDRMDLPVIGSHHGWMGLADRFLSNFLMYNRQGDLWFYHNIPGHRLLDDLTGVLWILGLAMALFSLRKPASFYSLTAWGFLALPAILSPYPPHASRALGDAGFVAFFAAWALMTLSHWIGSWFSSSQLVRTLLLVLGLGTIAALNFWTYFQVQAKDLFIWRDEGWAATRVGERIAASKGEEIYLASRFWEHYDILFQTYGKDLPIHLFPGAADLPHPSGKGLLFILDEGKSGTLHWLEGLYPGGVTEKDLDNEGRPLAYFYRVPPGGTQASLLAYQRSSQGLTGAYFQGEVGSGNPVASRRDALINFTFRNDFPLPGSPLLFAHWTGALIVPAAGNYRFLGLTTDECRLSLDRKEVFNQGNQGSKEIFLKKGPHPLDLYFEKTSGTDRALSLLWKKPGDEKYEVIPSAAYFSGTSK